MKHKPKEASSRQRGEDGQVARRVKAPSRSEGAARRDGKWEAGARDGEIGRRGMSLWWSHEERKSRRKVELSCGQRLLSPGF